MKILKFQARYAEELRAGVRANPTIEQILVANVMLPDVDTTREYWIPNPEQAAELAAINPRAAQNARRTEMLIAWRRAQLMENARRNTLNEVTNTRIDLEVKDFKERKDTILKI